MARIFLFISASPALSSRSSVLSRSYPSITILANLFSVSTILSSSIPSLFTIHKLYNTIHVVTISRIFFNGISDRFIINLHLSFSIPNALCTHILVKYYIKFQFVSFPDNAVFPPLNRQYIHGFTRYAMSLTSLYVWYFLVWFFSPEIWPNRVDFLPIRIHNLILCNLVEQSLVKLLSEIIFYNNNLFRQLLELK